MYRRSKTLISSIYLFRSDKKALLSNKTNQRGESYPIAESFAEDFCPKNIPREAHNRRCGSGLENVGVHKSSMLGQSGGRLYFGVALVQLSGKSYRLFLRYSTNIQKIWSKFFITLRISLVPLVGVNWMRKLCTCKVLYLEINFEEINFKIFCFTSMLDFKLNF